MQHCKLQQNITIEIIFITNGKQEHTESADLGKANPVRGFSEDFLVQRHTYDKIFEKIRSLFPEPNCGKMPHLAMLKNPRKIPRSRLRCA